jgi:hypothetical protein
MVSSTTSAVDPDAPSVFTYWERDGAIWGEYSGDTVTFGRFVGTRTGDSIRVSFVHVLVADGTVVTGDGESELERADDGRIRLVEHYEMHGAPQLSVCEEIPAA